MAILKLSRCKVQLHVMYYQHGVIFDLTGREAFAAGRAYSKKPLGSRAWNKKRNQRDSC